MKRFLFPLLALALLFMPARAEPVPAIKTFSSGNVTNAAAVATITSGGNNFAFITGFELTFAGATVGACVSPTVTGLLGGTATYVVCSSTGATLQGVPLIVKFDPPLKAATINTSIVVTLPALGAGNLFASAVAHGYFE